MNLSRLAARLLRVPTVRALRGATTVASDAPDAIAAGVTELVEALRRENALHDDEVISAIFTMTPDLTAAFPAATARGSGWGDVPLLCASEIAVPGGLARCLRVMVHVERVWADQRPRHVYLRDAVRLRPDWAAGGNEPTPERRGAEVTCSAPVRWPWWPVRRGPLLRA